MEIMMNKQENLSLQLAFTGEEKRDASASIRGFVYQNLLAIEELIKEDTDRVFCEYIEDITSVDKYGNCRIIQAKYYPSTLSSSMEKEVFREMYCQYLKLINEGGLKSVTSILNVFSVENKDISLPDKDLAVVWINDNPKQAIISNLSELSTKKLNKIERETAIIELCGTPDKLDAYYASYKIDQRKTDLDEFRLNLSENLVELLTDELEDSAFEALESDDQGKVLLGIAYLMILETFDRMRGKKGNDEILQHKEIKRADFIDRLKHCIEEHNDLVIVQTVQSMVMEVFFSILEVNSDLDKKKLQIIEKIVDNTVEWLKDILSDDKGQYSFYNSVSFESYNKVAKFKNLTVKKREKAFLKCFSGIKSFMKYLWKIMMNICLDKADFDFQKDANLMNPQYYIVESEKEYICFKFEKDFVKSSIILPSVNSDEGKEKRRLVYSRMYHVKPEKWFMGGDANTYGRYDYTYSPAEIRDDLQSISSVQDENDYFYLECMECIGIDNGDWKKTEVCTECIFNKKCIRGKV